MERVKLNGASGHYILLIPYKKKKVPHPAIKLFHRSYYMVVHALPFQSLMYLLKTA